MEEQTSIITTNPDSTSVPQPTPTYLAHQPITTLDIINKVIDKNLGLEYLDKMMDLQLRNEANEARKAYHAAFAAFKADPPQIFKDAKVAHKTIKGGMKKYNHASIGNVVATIISGLGQHGLSHSWDVEQEGKEISVTCILTHAMGHSERVKMTAPPDQSGGKNDIQAIASTTSYLQRYTVLSITGMATSEMDDDGRGYGQDRVDGPPKIPASEIIAGIRWYLDNNHSADILDKYLGDRLPSIELLSPEDQQQVRDYEAEVINEMMAKEEPTEEPETFICPNGGIDVKGVECGSCPKRPDCEVHKK